jgi:hydrogenase maturation protein HypF
VIDPRVVFDALIDDLSRGASRERVARRFHTTLVVIVADVCARLREHSGVERVVLSGGVFANAILAHEIPERLQRNGFEVFSHRKVPPNDGGLCFGQLAVAAHGGGVRRRFSPPVQSSLNAGSMPGSLQGVA